MTIQPIILVNYLKVVYMNKANVFLKGHTDHLHFILNELFGNLHKEAVCFIYLFFTRFKNIAVTFNILIAEQFKMIRYYNENKFSSQ